MSYKLPQELDKDVQAALEDRRKEGKVRRLWAADASLWTETDEGRWLGWLTGEQADEASRTSRILRRMSGGRGSGTYSCSAWAGRALVPRC